MSKIIVTGGVGFLGSHLVDRLINMGKEVLVIDDLSTGKRENLNPKAEFLKYDVSKLYYFPEKPVYVFHLAALPSVPYSVEHPSITHEVNVNGTFKVLEAARRAGTKKVIFTSTCAVYGETNDLPFKEYMIPDPQSPYALQKQIGEQYMRAFNKIYGLPTISLRLFNIYGSRSDPNSDYSLVISKFLRLKKEGRPLTIYGDGTQTRDYVYVEDVVDALILAMEKPVQNEIINICSGKETSVLGLADIIKKDRVFLPPRKGDIKKAVGDNSKAKRLLDWKPKTSLEEGIKKVKI